MAEKKETQIKVLLIDDDTDCFALTRHMLNKAGNGRYRLELATDAETGLNAMIHNRHDVYLLDYLLGKDNGVEVLREALAGGCLAPVILLTGADDLETDMAAMEAGAADFLSKGKIDGAMLDRAIRHALEWAGHVRALREAEDRLFAITSALGEGAYVLDLEGRLTFMNPEAERLLGWREQELSGKNAHEAFHSRKADGSPYPVSSCPIHRTLRTGKTRRADEEWMLRKDGTLLPVHLVATPLHRDGRLAGAVVVFQDISARLQAQRALQESEQRFRQMFNSGNDIILVHGVDAQGFPTAFVDVNQTACERLGYSREELLRMSPNDIDDPASAVDMPDLVKRLQAHERVVFERVFVTRDGKKIPVEISASLFELNGQPAALSIARDVSRRKQAEDQVRRTSEQMEGIFSSIHAMIALLDADFNFVRVNQAYAEADGHEPEFFIGKNHFDLYPDAENEAIFRKVVKTGQPYLAYAKPFRYPDHPERGTSYRDWALSPVKEEDGKATGLILSLVNVTERHMAELAREESERNLSALFEATPESVMLLDLDGVVLALNETAARRLKKSRQELLGQNVFDFFSPAVAKERRRWLDEVRRSGQTVRFDDMRKGIRFEHTVYPVFNAAGKVVRFAIYSVDVTELRQSEAIEKLLAEFNQRVMQGQELSDVLEFVCAEIAQRFDLQLAYIGEKKRDGSIQIVASAGEAIEFEKTLRQIGVRWDNSAQGKGPAGSAIRTGKAQVFKTSQPGFKPWRSSAEQFNLQAILAIPLIIRGEIYGVFNLYSRDAETFDPPAMVQRLSAIASRICVALEMAMDQRQLRLLGSALETTSNAVFITDLDGRIQWVNAAFTHLTGYGAQEAVGQTPRILNSGTQDKEYYRELWETIHGGESWSRETVERRKDGSLFTVQQTVTPIFDESGGISHFISILEDISARKLTEERIRRMAEYDALTELPNRVLFYDRLQQAMLVAKRKRDRLALLYLDLDRFKAVNDSLGHHVGDLLLQAVAQRLQECVRESDTVARLGGDEFTVILQEIGATEDVAQVAEKIIAALTAPFHLNGHKVTIGTSIGIVLYAGGAEIEPDQLVKLADGAMYGAKGRGGNTFEFAPG